MGEKYYDNALYSELQVCLNQIKTELKRSESYVHSKKDYDGEFLIDNEEYLLSKLIDRLYSVDNNLRGQIIISVPAGRVYKSNQVNLINPLLRTIWLQRYDSLYNKTPLALPFGEFYGYTIYNILYKNYEWIKYAFRKYNADVYGSNEFQTAVKEYFDTALAFYMRFENTKV